MSLNPDTQAFVDMIEAARASAPPVAEQTPEFARNRYRALAHVLGEGPELAGGIEELEIPRPGGSIGLRLYRPEKEGPHPVLLFFHGGGFVIGDLETHDKECRLLCERAECAVLAVDYRLAPEAKFPAAVEDAWTALSWVVEHGQTVGIDTSRVAVGGDSAGGNLAAVVALMARDAGIELKLQMLVYPATDASRHFDSFDENVDGPLLTVEVINWFWGHYIGQNAGERERGDWRFSPAKASTHSGVAKAYIATCSADPLRDEGNAYASLLDQSGVPVQHSMFEGEPHTLFQLFNTSESAKTLINECAKALAEAMK